jgi:hypothetical protein
VPGHDHRQTRRTAIVLESGGKPRNPHRRFLSSPGGSIRRMEGTRSGSATRSSP